MCTGTYFLFESNKPNVTTNKTKAGLQSQRKDRREKGALTENMLKAE